MIDLLIVGCLTSSGKYVMHVQDENKLTIDTIRRSFNTCNSGHPECRTGKVGLSLEKEDLEHRHRNFAFPHATYGPLNDLLRVVLNVQRA